MRTLPAIELDLLKARRRFHLLLNEQEAVVVASVRCSLCGSPPGLSCTKPSGGTRAPHAERLRAAHNAIVRSRVS